MYKNLKIHLANNIGRCHGKWVEKKNGYEKGLCDALDIKLDENRYQDASWGEYAIELKKGTSIWLDLVRYSEILIEKPELSTQMSINLFCVPDKDKNLITEILAVSTPRLLAKLNISITQAKSLIELRNHVPRQLNAQASLTIKDIRDISEFTVNILSDLLK